MPNPHLNDTKEPSYIGSDVLDAKEVAKIFRVTVKTALAMARDKHSGLVGHKIGREWRFHRDAIKNCLLGK